MRRAFTLVELLITTALVVIICVIALPNLFGANSQSDLTNTVSQVRLRLGDARTNSIDQTQGSAWGIHFSNPLNGTPSYSIFKGSSYASGTIVGNYPFPSDIGYASSTLAPGTSRDVIFSTASGASSISTTLTFDILANTVVSSTIFINAIGAINVGVPIAMGSGGSSGPPTTTQYLYIADSGGNRIEAFSLPTQPFFNTSFVSQFPCSSNACGSSSQNGYFGSPSGPSNIAVNSNGIIYVIDENNNRIEEFTPSYQYIAQLGCATGGCAIGSGEDQFDGPNAMAIDQRDNSVYVADSGNNRIVKYNSSGMFLYQIWCSSGACPTGSGRGGNRDNVSGEFLFPGGLFVDPSGDLWLTETNDRIEEWSSTGAFLRSIFGTPGFSCNGIAGPTSLAMDSSSSIYVVSSEGGCIVKASTAGVMLGSLPCTSGLCSVAVDSRNYVYVTDPDDNTFQVYSPSGVLVTTAGGYSAAPGNFIDIGGMYVHYP